MKVLICDDEPLAAQRLGDMLVRIGGVDLVGSTSNGLEALEQIELTKPDLLLLDIEMPRFDGFDVVEQLSRTHKNEDTPPPLIVFATAYPRFATLAFETSALDFLTKPVRQARLEQALARARTALQDREARHRLADLARQLEALRSEHQQPAGLQDLWVQRRGEMVRVDLTKVDWIGAEGEYVRLNLGEQSYLHRDLMRSMMSQLDPKMFLRVHRSFAVNRKRVASLRRSLHGGSTVLLDTGVELPIGRTYRQAVRLALVEKGSAADSGAPQESAPSRI
jgi:DNA-binding LytR/AlgR family response regulator